MELAEDHKGPRTAPVRPETPILKRPNIPIQFDAANYDRKDLAQVQKFMKDTTGVDDSVSDIRETDVMKYAWAFASLFGSNNAGYCSYPYAYFEDNETGTTHSWIKEFLGQIDISLVKGVRYFFGLETSLAYIPNRIRIILFPLWGHG